MKKHVLNIDRLYTGQTANALVLNQVDEDLPVLLPSVSVDDEDWEDRMREFKKIYPDFNTESIYDVDELNRRVVDFNLNLQNQFKEKRHPELYMLDDTLRMRPKDGDMNLALQKTYLHCINGKGDVGDKDVDEINSSQMNVLFPYRKVSIKSMYASQLTVQSAVDMDDILERERSITLQGMVSYEKCVQGIATVGGNLYVMSPNVDIGTEELTHVHGNGLSVVNSFQDRPFHFPHSITLFQPSQEQYDGMNLAKDVTGTTNFIEWYERHSRKTVISMSDTYGGNISTLRYLGLGSYEIQLATYAPTDILLIGGNGMEKDIRLDSTTFRRIRTKQDPDNVYQDGTYVFDNSAWDKPSDNVFGDVGLMFNMYDTFMSGKDRILKMHVPVDKEFDRLKFKMEWEVREPREFGLVGDFEAVVMYGEDEVFRHITGDSDNQAKTGKFAVDVIDTATMEHDILLTVRIHYNVDFGKRDAEKEYAEGLKKAGVVLKNIRLENGVSDDIVQLTFGSYVNEDGIDEKTQAERYNEFWRVSQYKKNMAYQTVVETSLKNLTSAGMKYPNNYSSGDIYGDMFVTKSVLDSHYDMNIGLSYWDEHSHEWTSEDNDDATRMLKAQGRDYIGLGDCSNQLSLFYKPMDIAIGYEREWRDLDDDGNKDADERVIARRSVNPENGLNYQMVEVVRNINRFESSIKHKMNVFSVVVENSNLAPDNSETRDEVLEKYKEQLRNSVTQFVRNTCEGIVPVHTQLFDVQFT